MGYTARMADSTTEKLDRILAKLDKMELELSVASGHAKESLRMLREQGSLRSPSPKPPKSK